MYSPSAVDHFYTTNGNEHNNAVQNLGYNDESITGYIYPSASCGGVPFYRLYNPTAHDHFYTANANEKNTAAQTGGYVDEGIAGYVLPETLLASDFQAPGAVPFYRMYSPTAVDHFYTTDEAQRSNAINNLGFNDEAIAGYIYPSTSQLYGSVPFYRMY
ncbi:hypothetical protein EV421DRAFT_1718854 [Armillaria borealis]|uniref:DUF5648 domain-containing protein n=1 Tax=Armillaria borealis TaxID=47425 RepID=A0AA39MFN1_9AGAR|nr:hypothetical protein EV421DRAFT_1718854 [Armillaria borealis]